MQATTQHPEWVTATEDAVRAREQAQREQREYELRQQCTAASDALRAELVPMLPAGVRVMTYTWTKRSSDVIAKAILDLGNGVIAELWPPTLRNMPKVVSEGEKPPIVSFKGWNAQDIAEKLLEFYKQAVEERARVEEKTWREAERQEREKRDDQLREQQRQLFTEASSAIYTIAQPVLGDLDRPEFIWGHLRVERPSPNTRVTLEEWQARLQEYAKQATARIKQLYEEKRVREDMARRAQEMEVLRQDVTLYYLRYPFCGIQEGGAWHDNADAYSLSKEPSGDGFWPIIDSDRQNSVRFVFVQGTIEVT